MNITGTLIEIYDTIQVNEKFKKREFVIQDSENPQYPQYIKFQLAQDKCILLDSRREGETIDVSYNITGRRYEKDGKKMYFNSLQAWKINLVSRKEAVTSEDDGLPF